MKTWIALLCSVCGAILVAVLYPAGYILLLLANTLWFIDSLKRNDSPQMCLWVIMSITCIIGYFQLSSI